MPFVFVISGEHNSGKTTLGTLLVQKFSKRGYKIGVIKSTKERDLITDKPNSDTFRYRMAGSCAVSLLQKDLVTLYLNKISKKDLSFFIESFFWNYDLVLLEGFRNLEGFPKVWVLREDEDSEDIGMKYPNIEIFVKVKESEKLFQWVEEKIRENQSDRIYLFINGKRIFLKPFLQKILEGLLLGFLKGLKDIPRSINHIELKIKKQKMR